MPAFANPFSGNIDRQISKEELIQAVQLDITGELGAIPLYDAHTQATDDKLVRKDPTLAKNLRSGESKVVKMMTKLGIPKEVI